MDQERRGRSVPRFERSYFRQAQRDLVGQPYVVMIAEEGVIGVQMIDEPREIREWSTELLARLEHRNSARIAPLIVGDDVERGIARPVVGNKKIVKP